MYAPICSASAAVAPLSGHGKQQHIGAFGAAGERGVSGGEPHTVAL
jgi:hypothetical protein